MSRKLEAGRKAPEEQGLWLGMKAILHHFCFRRLSRLFLKKKCYDVLGNEYSYDIVGNEYGVGIPIISETKLYD